MKSGWEVKTLGDICKVDWGNTNLTKKAFVEGGPYLGVSAAGCDGRMSHAEHKRLTPVLSAIGAQCGRMFLPNEDFTAIKNTITLTPLNGICDGTFLYYLLTLVDLPQRGAGQPFISKGDIQKFKIPLPPLEEQKRIVSILDEAFEGLDRARENAEANLKSAGELFDASLDAVFNSDKHLERTASALWEHKALGDISYVKSGGTPSKSKKQYWSGSIPWYSSGELNNRFTGAPNQMISQEGLDGSNAKIFAAGSLLIGIYDTAAMKMSILDRDAAFNQAIVGVLPGPGFSIDFLHLALKWMKPGLMNERRGTRQKNLSLSKIKEIQVPQPPLEEQDRTVSKLNNLEDACKSLEHLHRTKLQDISDLRQSLLQKAFRGELT